jgi:hypothetical protein
MAIMRRVIPLPIGAKPRCYQGLGKNAKVVRMSVEKVTALSRASYITQRVR